MAYLGGEDRQSVRNELPPAALELLKDIRDGVLIQDCRERYFERLAICVHDGLLSESEAHGVALSDLRKFLKGQTNEK